MLDLKADPWLAVGLAVLATWRLTHLLAREDGPFDVLARLRARLGRGFLGSLLDCFACVSVWVAAAMASLLFRDPVPWLLAWLGLSGAACWIDRFGQQPVVFETLRDSEKPHQPEIPPHELLRTTTRGASILGSPASGRDANPVPPTPDHPAA